MEAAHSADYVAPLERLYPMRCYDCLTPLSGTDVALGVLCANCRALYQRSRRPTHIDGSVARHA